jgi:succinate dehydrogenase/fumarate reductase flavoprotein subunit
MEYLSFDCIVIGTGAAGYNAAVRIKESGKKSVAIITENINFGTSRNTGSDKQTYYKLGLGGNTPDSVYNMAENLFACGSVDGDNALCEAALSIRCFMNLCELGVEFPHNRYGEYIGYKTDHDPFARATSAGPLTSKFMTEALEKKAKSLNLEILDKLLAVEILKDDRGVCGLIAINTETGEFIAIKTPDIIMATGGPAGIYADSVYPKCHTGSTSLAINAGAKLQNLTEWQYGLASVNPRWNVSGTYMQVLPRFVSVDERGNEFEFLMDFFKDKYEALSFVFLKGYQWPFDSKKVLSGSSVIDLLVYKECVFKKRKVYLDFTKNPFGLKDIEYDRLSADAYNYLNKAGSTFGTPIQRLFKMNAPAIELYKSKGVDLSAEYLEIALCAQHNNGGAAVDLWWQTSVKGLFAVGECAGTHGITRPGGSALNAGQAGSLRAAQFVINKGRSADTDSFVKISSAALQRHKNFCDNILKNQDNVDKKTAETQRLMSDCGGAIREKEKIEKALGIIRESIENFGSEVGVSDKAALYKAYKLKDILTVQAAVLEAFSDYSDKIRVSRGSALIYDKDGKLREGLDENFRIKTDDNIAADKIQEIVKEADGFKVCWRKVRPLPQSNDFFENVWRQYRENKNIF